MEEENRTISKKLLVLDIILITAIICMVFVIYGILNKSKTNRTDSYDQETSLKIFGDVELKAKSAYVFDVVKNEVLFKKNEFVQLPLASITKLMTALTAVELLPENSRITIRKEFLREEGDTGLLSGESWRLKDLLDFSLTVSSNDGARSVASVIGAMNLDTEDYDLGRKDFVSKMNDKARELGLGQTYFTNETGLDNGVLSGGYGSAMDVGVLMKYILLNHSKILEATKYQQLEITSLGGKHIAKNTNIDVNQIPGLLASKTGYTEMAGGNLVVVFDSSIGRPIIVVVLGSTLDDRFEDISRLVRASLAYINQ